MLGKVFKVLGKGEEMLGKLLGKGEGERMLGK